MERHERGRKIDGVQTCRTQDAWQSPLPALSPVLRWRCLTLPVTPVLTLEGGFPVVEQHDAHLPAIVLIHHPSTGVNEVLDGQARPWRHTCIRARRDGNLQAGLHHGAATCRHLCVFTAAAQGQARRWIVGSAGGVRRAGSST